MSKYKTTSKPHHCYYMDGEVDLIEGKLQFAPLNSSKWVVASDGLPKTVSHQSVRMRFADWLEEVIWQLTRRKDIAKKVNRSAQWAIFGRMLTPDNYIPFTGYERYATMLRGYIMQMEIDQVILSEEGVLEGLKYDDPDMKILVEAANCLEQVKWNGKFDRSLAN